MSRRKVTRRRPGREKATASSDAARPGIAESDDNADEVRLDDPAPDGPEPDEPDRDEPERHEVGFDDVIAQLYVDDSPALAFWKDRLSEYVDSQGTLDALRLRPASEQPWPASDNPMLGYLVERTIEMANEEGLDAAVRWLAANGWFEGAIAERSRFIRMLDAD